MIQTSRTFLYVLPVAVARSSPDDSWMHYVDDVVFSHNEMSPWAVVWRCLRDPPMFSRFSRTPTCDRWTDGQTDRHTTTAHAELAWRRAVKTGNIITRDVYRGSKYTLRHYKITLLNSTVSTYHICYHATKTSRDKTRKCVHHCKYISNDQPLSPLLTFQIFVDCRSMYKFIYKKIYSYI